MSDPQNHVKPLRDRRLVRKLLLAAPLQLGQRCLNAGHHGVAAYMLGAVARLYPDDLRVMHLRAIAAEHRGREQMAAQLRATRLRRLVVPLIERRDYTGLLIVMAEMERTHLTIQFKAGQMIARQLVTEEGRKRLLESARQARKRFRESAYLSHLISLCEAMQGDYREAAQRLLQEIDTPNAAAPALMEKRRRILEQSWRVVDLIARESMDWSEDPTHGCPQDREAAPPLAGDFKEKALQERRRDAYLELCDAEFRAAGEPGKKLRAIRDMLHVGIRHSPDYTGSYALATQRLMGIADDLECLFAPEAVLSPKDAARTVDDLCLYLWIARRLSLWTAAARIVTHLEALSLRGEVVNALWPAPGMIAGDSACLDVAERIMARVECQPPRTNRDARDYFSWAAEANRYDKADAFYAKLPKALHRRHGLLYHVNILQRQGRFREALKILTEVHGQSLANPSLLNPVTNHSLIKRTGELRFLIETERLYSSVKQPENPKAVVLIAPRNIDQLRRYPLMVLMEFKRQGTAVVPLIEGLLPREMTGDPAIDVMNGAISATCKLSEAAERAMPELTDFVADPSTGTLRWGEMDLSHAVWEDAAINRRRYSIDWACPELQHYIGRLMSWSAAIGRVLEHARGQHDLMGGKTACMSLFNSRMPDALFRFYCAARGDPETFFFLHAANGYQNYFSNFSTNISHRFALRNMTKVPKLRSASFPIPEYFEAYYAENTARIPQIMERFAGITKVTRSTVGLKTRAPEAAEADARIAAWRARGGKLACAFGKVVCDSGVPHDGGPAHRSMKDWINHSVRAVEGSDTLLLIKPHPHELNNEIATFLTECFRDLIDAPMSENALFLGHRWFDMHDMRERMDLGLVYNGTTAIELGLMGIPAVLCGDFAPVDYPIGHVVPKDRADYEAYLRFEKPAVVALDIRERAAVWLDYMANEDFTQSYRFHARPVTNKVLYPPYWFAEDLERAAAAPIPEVEELVGRALGERLEPGGDAALRHRREREEVDGQITSRLRTEQVSRRMAQDTLRLRARLSESQAS
ncbi:hypothetical protein RAZWK3B_03405 [Roseobacter sp. AzwK-3b]|uniref:hypothetical protein n=1 Tax=Roseobacter sp. AzwK-3b TaxID=351016 RepID=UPI0001569082|nr:hypothetical protein [Roseobacter sp. AzwK-3b]EDM73235.1 hypothetical protein RAZWK3B_03405 [Roseobacter sp. AzwK-3b]